MKWKAREIFTVIPILALASGGFAHESMNSDNPLNEFFEERFSSVVGVEYIVQHEIDRESQDDVGLVVDDEGLIVLNEGSIPGWIPPGQLNDFKVFLPGDDSEGFEADYLGQDYRTGWHYVRATRSIHDKLTPITAFPVGKTHPGMDVWGVYLLKRDFNYEPALTRSYVGLLKEMPLLTAFTGDEVGVSGSAVFNHQGAFLGWLNPSIAEEKILHMGRESYKVGIQSIRGTTVFLTAEVFLDRVGPLAEERIGDKGPWMGTVGMEALDKSVSKMLGLENRGAIVVSDIVEDSPAEEAGLKGGDIIVEINGEPIPKFYPSSVEIRYFEDRLLAHKPGETLKLSVIEEESEDFKELAVVLGEAPTRLREAERSYFESLGFSIRQFVLHDAINRRILSRDVEGAVSHFVRQNSAAATAGLRPGDWIKEIDGTEVENYEHAQTMLETIAGETSREEFVLLIERVNETQVLRVKLN